MGLFGNKEPQELNQLLDAMQGSSLGDIEAIRAGSPPPLTDSQSSSSVLAGMTLDKRISKAAALINKLQSKGKQGEAETILTEWEAKEVPVQAFGTSPEAMAELDRLSELRKVKSENLLPITGSGTAAQAEEKRREELQRLWAKDAQWKLVIEEIRERVRG
jgi:hypothetical protein